MIHDMVSVLKQYTHALMSYHKSFNKLQIKIRRILILICETIKLIFDIIPARKHSECNPCATAQALIH